MRSLRTLSRAGFRVLVPALLAACFSTGTASGHDSKGRSSSWDNLKSLTPGQEIRVVVKNAKCYQGEFESLSDGGITLRQAAGEQTLARKDILKRFPENGERPPGAKRVDWHGRWSRRWPRDWARALFCPKKLYLRPRVQLRLPPQSAPCGGPYASRCSGRRRYRPSSTDGWMA